MKVLSRIKLCLFFLCAVTICILLSQIEFCGESVIFLDNTQMVEDFEFLNLQLTELYPFWDEVSGQGVNKGSVYEKYRHLVGECKTDMQFLNCLNDYIREFKGIGHLSLITPVIYNYYDSLVSNSKLANRPEYTDIVGYVRGVVSAPKTAELYSSLDANSAVFRKSEGKQTKGAAPESGNPIAESGLTDMRMINDGKTAYIRFDSFLLDYLERDRQLLEEFYDKIANGGDLIIDIRDNGGGSDQYWTQLIVEPLTNRRLTNNRYFLFNDNETVRPYLDSALDKDGILDISLFPAFPNADYYKSKFEHFIVDETEVYPKGEPFTGKIWLLVSEKVYSSSENFAVFSKETGFATLVGSATGGDGGYEPILISLPNSGLLFRFSLFYGLNSDGSGNEAAGTAPDIYCGTADSMWVCLDIINGTKLMDNRYSVAG